MVALLKTRYRSAFLLAPAVILVAAIALGAQTNTGRLVGTVYDSDGAVVPGATVVVTDERSSRERTYVTDDQGGFIAPLLDIGDYTVRVTKDGFKTFTASGVRLEIGREFPLRISLEIGGQETTIDVTVGASLINATTAEISTTVTSKQLLDLPINLRNPLNLTLLQAGTSSNSAQNTSINGQRTSFANITRDGINIQDAFIRTNATDFAAGRPSSDDTEEFTISTLNAGADSGYGGAQIRLVTPRGSDEYHGALWNYNRNSALGANSFFNNRAGIKRPFRNRNQFGGKLGGRVPGLSDRVYFFSFYEGVRDRISSNANRTLLLPAARTGVFTYNDNSGTRRTIDLLSLVPGINAVDPVIKARVLDPQPTAGNRTDFGDQLNTTGISFSQPSNSTRNTYTNRVDLDVTPLQNINVVFVRNSETVQRPDVNDTQGFNALHPVEQLSVNTLFSGAHRWTPSGTFSNEARGGLFFSEVPFNRTVPKPAFFITPPTSVFSNPEVNFLSQGRDVRIYNIQDNAEKILGAHSLRFGGMMQLFQVNPYNEAGIVPTWTTGTNPNTPTLTAAMFPGGISAAQFNAANNLFALLGGIASTGTQSFNVESRNSGFRPVSRFEDYRYENYSLYLQDQWRATPELSINLGLRWEILSPPRLLNGTALEPVIPKGADPIQTILNPNGTYDFVGGNAGSTRFHKTDRDNFLPVVSFAYTVRPRGGLLETLFGGSGSETVIRGGYRESVVNDSTLTAARNALAGNAGLGTTTVNAVTGGTAQLNARFNALPPINAPAVVVPRTYAQNNSAGFNNFGTVFAVDPNIESTRIREYNLGIQRSFGSSTVLEVRYVGSRSSSLWRGTDYNQIDIRDNGFAEDFLRARRNLIANGNPEVGETLTVFPRLASGGLLGNAVIRNNLMLGVPGELAFIYIQNALTGNVRFLANPNTGVADLLTDDAAYRYNSLQVEVRRRLTDGFTFQANYTFGKNLTNAIGTGQFLFEPLLDLRQPNLEWARADYDTAQVFNLNSVYDLPFGRTIGAGVAPALKHIIGGWQISGIWRWTSGTPITITDARGTLNRGGRSTRQTPNTNKTLSEIKALTGRFENSRGIYFLNPSIVNPATGRASEGFASAPFAGQIFLPAEPGKTGTMGRALLDGPNYFNIDAAIAKNFDLTEGLKLQVRLEAINVLNHANLYSVQIIDVGSPNFGQLRSAWDPRRVQVSGRITF